ncbi:MAG TPA: hypothetical protein EYH06_03955 [Chromatiales bacterium]|nr:hypothetical protein [Thiotrichales bacterium]HIP67727.1 hypothetical protein [Chromatiales bacterium]
MADKMMFNTKLGYSFASGGDSPHHKATNMRSFCIAIENDSDYFEKNEPDKKEPFLKEIEVLVDRLLEFMDGSDRKLRGALADSGLEIVFNKPYKSINVDWPFENAATLKLMRAIQEADEIFAMLDLAKKKNVADGFKISMLRKPVINEITSVFDELQKSLRKAKKGREGSLYNLKL